MSVAKIIIFLLAIFFLVLAKKRKTDTYFFRNMIISIIMLITFYASCIFIITPFSCGNVLFMIGSIILVCNLGEKDNIYKYAMPFYGASILAYVVALTV